MKINEIITEDDKFNQFELREPFSSKGPLDPDAVRPVKDHTELANIIETNCGQMLSAYRKTNKVLLRGIKSNEMSVITNIRPDRLPVEMPIDAHLRLKKAFDYLGLKANRSNSIFCSADPQTAMVWGNLFVVFVKDGWSGTVWQRIPGAYFFDKAYDAAINPDYSHDIPKLANIINELQPLVVTPQNLDAVLDEHFKDILITGTSYIGLRYGTRPCEKVMKLLNLGPID